MKENAHFDSNIMHTDNLSETSDSVSKKIRELLRQSKRKHSYVAMQLWDKCIEKCHYELLSEENTCVVKCIEQAIRDLLSPSSQE